MTTKAHELTRVNSNVNYRLSEKESPSMYILVTNVSLWWRILTM
jgi:hypothetical protein